jgi:hypothetical protein
MDAKFEQLTPRHDTVLALRKRPQPRTPPQLVFLVVHGLPNASLGADSPPHPLGAVVGLRQADVIT